MNEWIREFNENKVRINELVAENEDLKRKLEQAERAIVELRQDRDYLRTIVDSREGNN